MPGRSVCGSHCRGAVGGGGSGAGGGVVGRPCQPEDGGGGAGAGGGGVAGAPCQADGGGARAGGGASPYFVPETQQPCGTARGTAFLSQQRAFGPCTPGFMYVN